MDEGTITTGSHADSVFIKRPRLTAILDASEARILLLCAPAGYGKTTLAREWVESREGVVWYAGGPALADVAAFAAGLGGALGGPGTVERIERLAGGGAPARALARAVASESGDCALLVLDDYHHALGSEDSETLLGELLQLTTFRLLVTTRTRPPWVTPRMLVYGHALELEMADLAFTGEEAYAVLGEVGLIRDHVVAQAAGWPAVIGLAAMRGPTIGVAQALSGAELYEFFAEDLFGRMPEELQQALQVLALAGDVDRTLAPELLGREFEELMDAAGYAGFLTASHPNTPTIHPLLKRFLLDKLRARKADEVVRRVVPVLVAHGRWDDCLTALERFPQDDLVVSALEPALVSLVDSGRLATLKRWVALGNRRKLSHPRLLLAESEIALREGDHRAGLTLGARAGEMLVGDESARAFIAAARAAHLLGKQQAVAEYVDRATAAGNVERERDAMWIAFVSAVEYPGERASQILDRLQKLGTDTTDHALRLAYGSVLVEYEGGTTRDAIAACELGTPLLAHSHDPLVRSAFLNIEADLSVRAGLYEAALTTALQQIAEADASGLRFAVGHAQINHAAALIGLRRFVEAQRILNDVVQTTAGRDEHVIANARLQLARVRMCLGDLERASILVSQSVPASASRGTYEEFVAHRALIGVACNHAGVVEDMASEIAKLWQTYARGLAQLATAAATVLTNEGEGTRGAVSALSAVLEAGDADCVVIACRTVPALARAGATQPALAQALTEVFMRSRDYDLGRSAGLNMPRELRRNETLSRRERDVYELLIQGRSNREIAKALFISVSTTKVHIRHIFEKLGVHSRAEAARLAGELDQPT